MQAMALPTPTARPRGGRWLGGVCAGLAARWGLRPSRVRGAFVLGALALGLGVLVYAAAWLILPGEDENGAGRRGIVALAQAGGALLGLVALGALGALATVFGFGWVIVALAAAVLVATLAGWTRLGPAWALLPVGALVLPSVALAVGGIKVEPSTRSRTVAPRTVAELPPRLDSGLGLLTVDLRHTAFPHDGTVDLKIDAGVRRTLIALPHDRCIHVEVDQHPVPVALRLASAMLGHGTTVLPDLVVFGRYRATEHLAPSGRRARHAGPTLHVDFVSDGGALVVRDYPDDVDPRSQPDWPGYPVAIEPRPDTAGMPRAAAAELVRDWRARREQQALSKQRVDSLMLGPCAIPELFP